MPYSATERFARTYTPRIPDDSYDSLGGADIPDSIIKELPERPFHYVYITSGFTSGILAETLVPSGQETRVNLSTLFTSGYLQTQAIAAQAQEDKLALTSAMAGGTLQ
jgi:hypothetical protein